MKYTKEYLEPIIKNNVSFAGVLREIGAKQSGGMQSHIRGLVKKYEIDISHFLGYASNKGRKFSKRPAKDILVLGKVEHAYILRRALAETGRLYLCAKCDVGNIWQDKNLILEVHHKDGNRENNQDDNLDFLCPNCHSQTKNYGSKNHIPE